MSSLIIISLLVFFFGYVLTVIIIYKNRKKFWAKGDDSPYFDGPDASGDISINHPHSSASHDSPDIGDVDA